MKQKTYLFFVFCLFIQTAFGYQPTAPSLNAISNSDGNGSYNVSWNYSLESFPGYSFQKYQLQDIGTGAIYTISSYTSKQKSISGKSEGTYSYRVRVAYEYESADGPSREGKDASAKTAAWNPPVIYSGWSNMRSVTVQPQPPSAITMNAITKQGYHGYTVRWNAAANVSGYTFQNYELNELNSGTTTVITTQSTTSKAFTNQSIRSYRFRIRAKFKTTSGTTVYTQWSSEASIRINIPVPNLNSIPFISSSPSLGASRIIQLSWNAVPDNAIDESAQLGYITLLRYEVQNVNTGEIRQLDELAMDWVEQTPKSYSFRIRSLYELEIQEYEQDGGGIRYEIVPSEWSGAKAVSVPACGDGYRIQRSGVCGPALAELRILTYNTYFIDIPGFYPCEDDAPYMRERSVEMFEFFTSDESYYDYVALQETFEDIPRSVIRSGSSYKYPNQVDARPIGTGMYSNGGLTNLSKFPFERKHNYRWDDCQGNDCWANKGFTFNELELDNGVKVSVVNLHLNADGSDWCDLAFWVNKHSVSRRLQLLQLKRWVDQNAAGDLIIYVGDFNIQGPTAVSTGNSGEYERIFDILGSDIRDVWAESYQTNWAPGNCQAGYAEAGYTYFPNVVTSENPPAPYVGSCSNNSLSSGPNARLDYIFVDDSRPNAQDYIIEIADVKIERMQGRVTQYLSDHFGVGATIKIHAKPPPPPLTVSISGPTYVSSGGKGTWRTTVSNNEGTVSYKWFKKEKGAFEWSQIATTSTLTTIITTKTEFRVDITSEGKTASDYYAVTSDRKILYYGASKGKSLGMTAFPNPTDGSINIHLDTDGDFEVEVELINLAGQVVKKWDLGQIGNYQNLHELDLEGIETGLYLLRVAGQSAGETVLKTTRISISR